MSVYFYGCMTLDGYLAGRDHSLDWLHHCGTVEETGYEEFYRRMDVTVMGRRTFRELERLEHPERIYSTTRNYVFTHEKHPPREGFRFVSGDVPAFIQGLNQNENIWIIGGNTILAPLLDADMVDCMFVQIAPVLLGGGIPLFAQKERTRQFQLEELRRYGQFAELICRRK